MLKDTKKRKEEEEKKEERTGRKAKKKSQEKRRKKKKKKEEAKTGIKEAGTKQAGGKRSESRAGGWDWRFAREFAPDCLQGSPRPNPATLVELGVSRQSATGCRVEGGADESLS